MTDKPTIVVAGDVCIDWLSIPVEPVLIESQQRVPDNWQLRGGRHMYARRGGAWLTADMTAWATRDKAIVVRGPSSKTS